MVVGGHRAGVGIVIGSALADQFALHEAVWEESEPGRAAALRLKGPHGSLELLVTYFPTGSSEPIAPGGAP